MDKRNITSIVINYDNGEIETLNKGVVVGFDEIDNEEETIKVRYRMCDIKGSELAMVVEAIIALGDKLGMFDNGVIAMKMIKVKIDTLISKLEEIKASGHETVHLSIVEGVPKHKIPAHVDLDADKDFRCVLEVRE